MKIRFLICETENDAKPIIKKNRSEIFEKGLKKKEEITKEDGQDGPLFPKKFIEFIRKIPDEIGMKPLIPTNFSRIGFIELLARSKLNDEKVEELATAQALSFIQDYLLGIAKEGQKVDFNSFSYFSQLIRNAEEWHAENFKARDSGKQFKTNNIVFDCGDGWTIVEISTRFKNSKEEVEHDLKLESEIMGHCVGTIHCETVLKDGERIFSLRDPKGKPHVTMNDFGHGIQEIKGKENSPPIVEYMNRVVDFVMDIGLNKNNNDLLEYIREVDPEKIGFIKKVTYSRSSPIVKNVEESGEITFSRKLKDLEDVIQHKRTGKILSSQSRSSVTQIVKPEQNNYSYGCSIYFFGEDDGQGFDQTMGYIDKKSLLINFNGIVKKQQINPIVNVIYSQLKDDKKQIELLCYHIMNGEYDKINDLSDSPLWKIMAIYSENPNRYYEMHDCFDNISIFPKIASVHELSRKKQILQCIDSQAKLKQFIQYVKNVLAVAQQFNKKEKISKFKRGLVNLANTKAEELFHEVEKGKQSQELQKNEAVMKLYKEEKAFVVIIDKLLKAFDFIEASEEEIPF